MTEPTPRERKPRLEMNQPIEDLDRFLAEHIRSVVGVIDAVRHGHTDYTERYPDLTEEGERAVVQTGQALVQEAQRLSQIAHDTGMTEFKQRLFFISSPQARAHASNDRIRDQFIAQLTAEDAIELSDGGKVRTMSELRAMRIHKLGDALQLLVQIADGDWTPRRADYIHVTSDAHAERDDLWETRPNVQKRGLGALGRAGKFMNVFHKATGEIPHAVATSHFELLNHVVMDIFQLSPEEQADELLQRAEHFTLYMLQSSAPDRIPMVIQFRGQARQVMFNMRTKQFA